MASCLLVTLSSVFHHVICSLCAAWSEFDGGKLPGPLLLPGKIVLFSTGSILGIFQMDLLEFCEKS